MQVLLQSTALDCEEGARKGQERIGYQDEGLADGILYKQGNLREEKGVRRQSMQRQDARDHRMYDGEPVKERLSSYAMA